jgi:glycosyltransferase involved in cell wall biosynthesis
MPHLQRLLRSIEEQSRSPDEVVIVDGGSTDGTYEALLNWANGAPSRSILQAPGANIARGRNLAIETATGEIIAVTDAGVTLPPDWLGSLVDALDATPAAAVASGFFAPDPHGVFERALAAATLPSVRDVDAGTFLPSSRSVAFRRRAWAAVGGYPEWLDYCEDLVFDLALRRAGFRFAWVPEAVVDFRPRPTFGAFFRQYYLYARGDGKAGLWPMRHAIRYGTYLVCLPLLWAGRRHLSVVACGVLAAALYLRRPVERLIQLDRVRHRDQGRLDEREGDTPSPQPSPRGRGLG